MTPSKNQYALVILAAGSSSRLGSPKQLVSYGKDSLLGHILRETGKSKVDKIFLVLGYQGQEILKEVESLLRPDRFLVVLNEDYEKGMGNSMAFAMRNVISDDFEAVIFSVCDQPHLDEVVINRLIDAFEKREKQIISCRYSKSFGPPTLFGKKYFSNIQKLTGDKGARRILEKNPSDVGYIDFPKGDLDIDTEEDLAKLS